MAFSNTVKIEVIAVGRENVTAVMKQTTAATSKFEKKAKQTAGTMNLLKGSMAFMGVGFGISYFKNLGSAVYDSGRNVAGFESMLLSLGGTMKTQMATIAQVQAESQNMFSMEQIAKAKAKVKAFGLDLDITGDFMSRLAEKAAFVGVPLDLAIESVLNGLAKLETRVLDNIGIVIKIGKVNKAYAKSLGTTVQELTAKQQQVALTEEFMRMLMDTTEGNIGTLGKYMEMEAAVADETLRLNKALHELGAPALWNSIRLGWMKAKVAFIEMLTASKDADFSETAYQLKVAAQEAEKQIQKLAQLEKEAAYTKSKLGPLASRARINLEVKLNAQLVEIEKQHLAVIAAVREKADKEELKVLEERRKAMEEERSGALIDKTLKQAIKRAKLETTRLKALEESLKRMKVDVTAGETTYGKKTWTAGKHYRTEYISIQKLISELQEKIEKQRSITTIAINEKTNATLAKNAIDHARKIADLNKKQFELEVKRLKALSMVSVHLGMMAEPKDTPLYKMLQSIMSPEAFKLIDDGLKKVIGSMDKGEAGLRAHESMADYLGEYRNLDPNLEAEKKKKGRSGPAQVDHAKRMAEVKAELAAVNVKLLHQEDDFANQGDRLYQINQRNREGVEKVTAAYTKRRDAILREVDAGKYKADLAEKELKLILKLADALRRLLDEKKAIEKKDHDEIKALEKKNRLIARTAEMQQIMVGGLDQSIGLMNQYSESTSAAGYAMLDFGLMQQEESARQVKAKERLSAKGKDKIEHDEYLKMLEESKQRQIMGGISLAQRAADGMIENERAKAAVMAAMEVAKGWATLDRPWISAGHFTAAALFAGVAATGYGTDAGAGAGAKGKGKKKAALAGAGDDSRTVIINFTEGVVLGDKQGIAKAIQTATDANYGTGYYGGGV